MTDFFDLLETRDPEVREREQLSRLPLQIAHAKAHAPTFARILASVDPTEITTRDALAQLPVTRKGDLIELQRNAPPFGGLATTHWGRVRRVFASPGPIFEPEGTAPDYWRLARALYASGFRAGDLIQNCFSYHFSPAGFMFETAAQAVGCTTFPAGTGQTEQQVRTMAALGSDGYVGTSSFLKIIVEKADELDVKLPRMRKALVSGDAFPGTLREALTARGVAAHEAYVTADVGLIAYESIGREGLIIDEGVLLEIVRPGTGDPVPIGEVGEVVVTNLFAFDYPLIRFATGDLSAFLDGQSPCGRTNARVKGWMGRADQTTKVKGLFVHPEQVAAIAKRHDEILRARLVIDSSDGDDRMTLEVEIADETAWHRDLITESIGNVTRLRGNVVCRRPGELPNDGKVIEDRRQHH